MEKNEIIGTFERYNLHGAFTQTLYALKMNHLFAAANLARSEKRWVKIASNPGGAFSALNQASLPPNFDKEVDNAINEIERAARSDDR